MGELVQALKSLCKVLDNLLGISLKPEIFRLAKLNRLSTNETGLFWDVLHRLCCSSASSTCKSDASKCVVNFLMKRGADIAYLMIPGDNGRQLLLCFAWLLAQGAIEAIIDKVILESPLGQELPPQLEKFESETPLRPDGQDPDTLLQYALLLTRKIQHNLKAIANYREEITKLFAKIHKVTEVVRGLPHLSVGDVRLLLKPDTLQDFLNACQSCLRVLETYSKWQKRSPVFWKWMDVILKEEEALVSNKPLTVEELTHLNTFLKNLENSVRQTVLSEVAHGAVEDNALGYTFRRLHHTEDPKVLDHVIEKLDAEIDSLTKFNEKKRRELQTKWSTNKNINNYEAIDINTVLDRIVSNIQTTRPVPSPTESLQNMVGALSLGCQ